MCGITGVVWTAPDLRPSAEQFDRMIDSLAHRGPDDRGEWRREPAVDGAGRSLPGVALGFRRLAIIDLVTGRQPMLDEHEELALVFNGEIYNYVELRRRLEGNGARFRTQSDTEVILHLYREVGVDLFEHLNGMFAIALWDRRRGRLVLGRDRLGKKPLVYAQGAGRIAFASELKSLIDLPGLDRSLDERAIDEFITYQYVPHPHTIYRHLNKLPPGCRAIWQGGSLKVEPYWRIDWTAEWNEIGEAEAIERTRELVEDAVRIRMRSDVPLGAFLSGGIDSSIIAAVMTRLSDRPIRTFSIAFPHPEFDESAHAREVATALGTEHAEFTVEPRAMEILPQLVRFYDEPFGDSSAIPTWYLSEMTRRSVTVALSGDGGDELFGGYERYQAVRLGEWLDRSGPLRRLAAAGFWQRLPSGRSQRNLLRRFRRFAEAAADDPVGRYLAWMSIFDARRRGDLYRPEFVERLGDADPRAFLERAWERSRGRDAVACASAADLQTYLPCDLMTKVDIASMAHGLECRQPFLDVRLVEFAASLPTHLKRRGGIGKLLLRKAYRDRLPETVWRRPKMGFGVPLAPWFRNELRPLLEDSIGRADARIAAWFRPEAIRRLIDDHVARRFDHGYRLWSLLILELWCREWRVG